VSVLTLLSVELNQKVSSVLEKSGDVASGAFSTVPLSVDFFLFVPLFCGTQALRNTNTSNKM
jgi:hypothetical protein